MAEIFVGNDATLSIEIRAKSSGALVDLTGTSRCVFRLARLNIDSSEYPSAFDWDSDGAVGILHIDLTGFELPAGSFGGRLTVYDATYPAGAVVVDSLPVTIGAAIPGTVPLDVDDLAAHIALTAAHGSDGDVVGKDFLASVTSGEGADAVGYGTGTVKDELDALELAVGQVAADLESHDEDADRHLVAGSGLSSVKIGIMTLTLGDGTDADTVAVVHSSSKSYGAATAYTGGGEDNLGNGTYFQVSGGTVFEIKGTALGGTKVANGVISANVEVFVGTTETAVTCEFHANTTTGFSFQFYDQTGTVIDLPTFMDGTPGNNIKARFAYLVS